MNQSRDNYLTFIDQIVVLYARHNTCPYHAVMHEVDLEDICDFFMYLLDEESRKKQKEMLDKFEGL